jgi:hypothetical protein
VLRFPASGVTVTGFVELREESQHTDRFVVRVDRIDGGRIEEPPRRVRLSVKRDGAGAGIIRRSQSLDPPLQPLEPGSYDFACALPVTGGILAGAAAGGATTETGPTGPAGPTGNLGPRFARASGSCVKFQYRRNRPTSLPWIRTRFGGRMRTS